MYLLVFLRYLSLRKLWNVFLWSASQRKYFLSNTNKVLHRVTLFSLPVHSHLTWSLKKQRQRKLSNVSKITQIETTKLKLESGNLYLLCLREIFHDSTEPCLLKCLLHYRSVLQGSSNGTGSLKSNIGINIARYKRDC